MKLSNKLNKTLLHSWQFSALGTEWSIETGTLLSDEMRVLITRRVEAFDQTYSRFRRDSLVTQLRQPGSYEFPDDCTKLMTLYERLYKLTDGKMTPLIGTQLEDAGYDAAYTFQAKTVRPVAPFSALGWDGGRRFVTTEPIVLDVGAAGKGYLIDIVALLLEQQGTREYTIDASGDIRRKSSTIEVIGLEHPGDPSQVVGVARVTSGSLCASAINQRVWADGMHHMFDPTTGRPVQSKLATWVVAEDAMVADGLATALFFVEPALLRNEFLFEYVTIGLDGAVDYSPQFEGELFV